MRTVSELEKANPHRHAHHGFTAVQYSTSNPSYPQTDQRTQSSYTPTRGRTMFPTVLPSTYVLTVHRRPLKKIEDSVATPSSAIEESTWSRLVEAHEAHEAAISLSHRARRPYLRARRGRSRCSASSSSPECRACSSP